MILIGLAIFTFGYLITHYTEIARNGVSMFRGIKISINWNDHMPPQSYAKSADFYLSKGFSPKMAEYFASGRRKIISVHANKDFSLSLIFDNGEHRIFDMKPLLKENTVFEHLLKFENFNRVYVDDSNNVCWNKDPDINSEVDWNNKIDLSGDVCYVEGLADKKI